MHDDVTKKRCSWVGVDDRLMLQYHDREWGVPVHDDRKHFEFLVLEGAQAGLSWTIVLKKREGYRRAFDGFVPEKVARFSARRIEKLALWKFSVPHSQTPKPTTRLVMALSPGGQPWPQNNPGIVLSPDGTHLVYVGYRGG